MEVYNKTNTFYGAMWYISITGSLFNKQKNGMENILLLRKHDCLAKIWFPCYCSKIGNQMWICSATPA